MIRTEYGLEDGNKEIVICSVCDNGGFRCYRVCRGRKGDHFSKYEDLADFTTLPEAQSFIDKLFTEEK